MGRHNFAIFICYNSKVGKIDKKSTMMGVVLIEKYDKNNDGAYISSFNASWSWKRYN